MKPDFKNSELIICQYDDMHPYECHGFDRLKRCVHCIRQTTDEHNPDYCWLCHNGQPPKEYKV